MAIPPIVMNSTVNMTGEYSHLRHAEDSRGVQVQQHFQNVLDREIDVRVNHVNDKDNVEKDNRGFDAKEKGSNEYRGNRDNKQKKDNNTSEGKVVIKNRGSFDTTI